MLCKHVHGLGELRSLRSTTKIHNKHACDEVESANQPAQSTHAYPRLTLAHPFTRPPTYESNQESPKIHSPGVDVAAHRHVPAVGEGVLELAAPLEEKPALVVHQPDVRRPVQFVMYV